VGGVFSSANATNSICSQYQEAPHIMQLAPLAPCHCSVSS
jgi:hypothetical protein